MTDTSQDTPDLQQTEHPVRDVIDRLDKMSERDQISLGDLLDAFGRTSFIPALMIPAILVVSPLSGIPAFSTICGLTIVLIAAQMFVSCNRLWLPSVLTRRCIKGDKLHDAMMKLERLADVIDRISRDRWRFLTTSPGNRVPFALCLTAGLMMPLLEIVPFSSSILGVAVLCCSVALLARDGLFVLIGAAFIPVAGLVPFLVVQQVASA